MIPMPLIRKTLELPVNNDNEILIRAKMKEIGMLYFSKKL